MRLFTRIWLFIFLIAWMSLIFFFSAENATESSVKSSGISYKIAQVFVEDFENLSEKEQAKIIEKISFPIRKTAHFCIFGVLSVMVFFNFYFFDRISYGNKYKIAFVFSSMYAATDEIHQRFVPGRSCELRDWIIDSLGALIGLLVLFGFLYIYYGYKRVEAGGERKMRKKELISENKFISEELQRLKTENETIKSQLDSKLEEIKLLHEKIKELNLRLAAKTDELNRVVQSLSANGGYVEELEEENHDILEYGAVIIGKVIVSGAEYSIRMESDDQESVEAAKQVILERVEQVKSEILDIIFSDSSYDKMCQLMEREYQSAVSFFDRVVARV